MGSIPGLGRSPGERNVFQFSCLENSMDRGAWCTPIHGAAKSQIQLNNFHFNESIHFFREKVSNTPFCPGSLETVLGQYRCSCL